jgi:transposase-like protein
MPKIRKIKIEDRKDLRGGGYSRRKFTVEEADAIRKEYSTSANKITISSLARKYSVSQPLMYQLIKGTTYTEGGTRGAKGGRGSTTRNIVGGKL